MKLKKHPPGVCSPEPTATLSAHAATELTPEQAAALKPYDHALSSPAGLMPLAMRYRQYRAKPTKTARPHSMLSTRRTTAMAATGASRLTL